MSVIILEDMETSFGRIKIYQSPGDGSLTFYQDSCFQSRCDAKGQSLIAYIHAMQGMVLRAGARRVAVLGCAGGTLATMLSLSGCNVTMVDINPLSFDLARRYFHLPSDVECIEADARQFLAATPERFDAIAMDVFDCGRIPPHLSTAEFFGIAASRLKEGGVIAVNTIIDHDLDLMADRIAASIEQATSVQAVLLDSLEGPDRNIVVVAGYRNDYILPRGHEPDIIQKELRAMIPRQKRRQALALHDDTGRL